MTTKTGLHTLRLVFPPFSNQEGVWLWEDGEIKETVKSSKLYMIGQREEAFFENVVFNEREELIFDITCGNEILKQVALALEQFRDSKKGEFVVRGGKNHFEIFLVDSERNPTSEDRIQWFTPDKLLFCYWKEFISADNLKTYRSLLDFKLHYVGISKKGDSFSRLFEQGHENRVSILSNETQLNPKARLTDELKIFLFEIEDMTVNIVPAKEISSHKFDQRPLDPAILAADAEKAFVSIMKSQYNDIQFGQYPKGKDGLWGQNYTKYGFAMHEHISFKTSTTTFKGGWIFMDEGGPQSDFIAIEGDNVSLIHLSPPEK